MILNDILPRLATATPEQLESVASALCGLRLETSEQPQDRRLFTMAEAARELNVSRSTVARMVRDGYLQTIATRACGSRRIASQSITDFISGKGRKA